MSHCKSIKLLPNSKEAIEFIIDLICSGKSITKFTYFTEYVQELEVVIYIWPIRYYMQAFCRQLIIIYL